MPKQYAETTAYSRDVGFDLYILYDVSNREEYICSSTGGITTSVSGWNIYKLGYDGISSRIIKKRYANGSDSFDKIADNYSTYNYTDI